MRYGAGFEFLPNLRAEATKNTASQLQHPNTAHCIIMKIYVCPFKMQGLRIGIASA